MWIPILVSAVAVFIVSSVIHMVTPWHKGDFPRMANESEVLDALRALGIPPGDYLIPRPATRQEMGSPEFKEKVARGPVVLLTVMKGGSRMAQSLGGWFVYLLVVSTIASHVAWRGLPPTPMPWHVFHEVALTAGAGYVLALWQMSIWYGRAWSLAIKSTIDGVIYAVITGLVFAWLWPT